MHHEANNLPESDDSEELSFQEIYTAALLNGEVIITIPKEELERVKVGLKNLKTKQAGKMKAEGLIPDPSVFTFIEREPFNTEYNKDFFIDLSIQLSRRATVKVAAIRIPSDDF